MEITEISNEGSQYNQVLDLLRQFDIHSAKCIEFVDSSQGEDDIRHNYIIDKKYVLRLNSAKVMTEERLNELNIRQGTVLCLDTAGRTLPTRGRPMMPKLTPSPAHPPMENLP